MPSDRFILAIECSNPSADASTRPEGPGVAFGRLSDGAASVETLGTEHVRPTGRGGHDDDLLPAIDRLCRRVGWRPANGGLERVAVSVGPGGYTSVRVVCAVGKMIAEANGAKCVAAPTASVVHESLPENLRSTPIAVSLAGKSDSAWVQVFVGGEPGGPGRLMTATDVLSLSSHGVRTLIADRFLPAPMLAAANSAGIAIIEPTFDAAACIRLGARLETIDPIELVPIYPREPDAVTLWRALKKS